MIYDLKDSCVHLSIVHSQLHGNTLHLCHNILKSLLGCFQHSPSPRPLPFTYRSGYAVHRIAVEPHIGHSSLLLVHISETRLSPVNVTHPRFISAHFIGHMHERSVADVCDP